MWATPISCPNCALTLDVGLAQLAVGLAWHYKRFENEQTPEERGRYAFAEDEARARHVGLWADPKPVSPWDWRKDRTKPSPEAKRRDPPYSPSLGAVVRRS